MEWFPSIFMELSGCLNNSESHITIYRLILYVLSYIIIFLRMYHQTIIIISFLHWHCPCRLFIPWTVPLYLKEMCQLQMHLFLYILYILFFSNTDLVVVNIVFGLISSKHIFPLAPSLSTFLLSKLTLGLNTCRQSWCHADCSPVPLYTSSLLDLVLLCPGHNIYLWFRMFDL